jgi:hypothetical protein
MLIFLLWWPPFFLMYLQIVCVCFTWLLVTRFREMCADWRVFGACLAVYLFEQQLPLYCIRMIVEDRSDNRTKTLLQMKRFIYIYIHIYIYMYMYHVSSTMYVEMGVCVQNTCYDMKPEKYMDKGHNGPSVLDIN